MSITVHRAAAIVRRSAILRFANPLTHAALAAVAVFAAAAPASATVVSFGCITGNSASDCTTGEAQLSVELATSGADQVSFTFTNAGPGASSITDVYFDDGTLLALASIENGAGVDFSQYAAPGNLPGGNSIDPPFRVTAGFSADSNPPVQPSGVNPGEALTIFFSLQAGRDVDDVLEDLVSGALRIGMHVQGFSGGGSESFVNLTPVPLPGAAWLLLSGLGALGVLSRRRS